MQAAIEAKNADRDDPATKAFGNMILAYERNEPGNFNKSLEEYRGIIDKSLPAEAAISKFEVFFNHFSPFYHCIVLYIFVFLIAALAWAFRPESINRSAFWLCTLTLIVHTWALLARMYIQGRPPVTNLYSSAVFNFIPKTAMDFYHAVAADDMATQHRLLREFFMPYLAIRNRVQGYAVSIVKAGAKLVGHDAGPVRAPLTDLKADELAQLDALIRKLGPQ